MATRTSGSGGGPGKRTRRKAGHRAPGRPHLGLDAVDQVRRRVQQDTLGHRGHASDPLFRIRRLLRRGHDHHTTRSWARMLAGLAAGDHDEEVGRA